MSKLSSSVLEKVSENNNEYRTVLRDLNINIDERTSELVSELVTKTGYTLDFSKSLSDAKEDIVKPVSRIIESYVIRDLRSVETVNEQFIEKINDKLDNTDMNSSEEKENFINNLNSLLNDKYLEIVKIKRIDFLNQDGKNAEIEEKINSYVQSIRSLVMVDDSMLDLISSYKNDLYNMVKKSIDEISSLYQNNFVNEVNTNLNGIIDTLDEDVIASTPEEFKPFIPEMNVMPEVPAFEPNIDAPVDALTDIPVINEEPLTAQPTTSDFSFMTNETLNEDMNDSDDEDDTSEGNELEITPISPIEIKSEEASKHSYDVDEILKIAKSPILEIPSVPEEKEESFVNVTPFASEIEIDNIESEFDETEIVEEMIRRLNVRLEGIKARKESYNEEKEKLDEDEAFVNDLISSSNTKKEELDKFEEQLNEKEERLNKKKEELDKKINDVMPFANAVLNTEKES